MTPLRLLRLYIGNSPIVRVSAYMAGNIRYAVLDKLGVGLRPKVEQTGPSPRGRLAICLRFRDEARYLREWLEYYIAAGVDHFFLYNNFSIDNYEQVLRPYISAGHVTLIQWPYCPASPAAENDCIARTKGHFEWVGFIDADEFVVIKDGSSIPDYLDCFGPVCGVALHWYYFGSNGHTQRPDDQVINAYTRREASPAILFKVFVRPAMVVRNRNSHNFFYCGARCAVGEDGRKVYGSLRKPPAAEQAWINHYHYKSLEDYIEKASRRSTLDLSGIRDPTHVMERAQSVMTYSNDVVDCCAQAYFNARVAKMAASHDEGAT